MPTFRLLPLLAAGLAAGCGPGRAVLPVRPAPPPLPAGPRAVPVPDVDAVPAALPPAAPPAGPYQHLSAEECRRRACAHAPGADLLTAAARADDRHPAEAHRVRQTLARHLAAEARNQAAGAALDLYYRLLEAELLADLLTAAAAEADDLLRTAEGFRDRGFADGAELARVRRQQLDGRAELLRVRQGGRRLEAELRHLLGDCGPEPLLPVDAVRVAPDRLDPDAAVAHGLARRADLQGLRELDAALGPGTVAVRQAVRGLAPPVQAVTAEAVNLLPAAVAKLLPGLAADDVAAHRDLLRQVLAERTRTAEKDIRSAVDDWAAQQGLVAVAKRRAEAERQRLGELAGRRAGGAAVEAAYRAARLDALRADADLVREAVKWKRADVAARQAMGLLCGPGECPPAGGCE